MEYTKPEVTTMASPNDAIHSSQLKIFIFRFDSFICLATNAAYEADE
jgi:hypothetical protein